MGYLVRFAKPLNDFIMPYMCLRTLKKTPQCQFVFDVESGVYVRGLNEATSPTKLESPPGSPLGSIEENGPDINEILGVLSKRTMIESIINTFTSRRKNYAEGIVTFQLRNGKKKKIKPPATFLQTTIYEEPPVSKTEETSESAIEKARIVKLKKAFQQSLEHQPIPREITKLLLVSIVLLASVIFFSGLEYGLSESILNGLKGTFEIAWLRANIFRFIGGSAYLGLSLAYFQEGLLNTYGNFTSQSQYADYLKDQLGNNIGEIAGILKRIEKSTRNFPEIEHDLIVSKDVVIRNYGFNGILRDSKNTTFIEAILAMNSALLSLKRTPLNRISTTNQDLVFFQDNYFNAISVKMPQSYSRIDSILKAYPTKELSIEFTLFLISSGFTLFFVLLMVPYILKAKGSKKNVLTNFLKIPKAAINKLCVKCERYLSYTENDDAQEHLLTIKGNASEESEEIAPIESILEEDNERRGRQFRGTSNEKCGLLLKCILVMLVLNSTYFFYFYFTTQKGEKAERIYKSINAICGLEENTLHSLNVLRETLLKSNLKIMYLNNKIGIAESMVTKERTLLEVVLRTAMFVDGGGPLDEASVNYARKWLHSSICDTWKIYGLFKGLEDCKTFMSGITTKGTYSLISEYLFFYRKYMTLCNSRSTQELLNSAEWVNQWQLLHSILSVQFSAYNEYYQKELNKLLEDTLRFKAGIMLGFIFGVFFIFVAFWIPYLVQLRTELWRTDGMLVLIPNNVIFHSKLLKDLFVKKNPLLTQEIKD